MCCCFGLLKALSVRDDGDPLEMLGWKEALIPVGHLSSEVLCSSLHLVANCIQTLKHGFPQVANTSVIKVRPVPGIYIFLRAEKACVSQSQFDSDSVLTNYARYPPPKEMGLTFAR